MSELNQPSCMKIYCELYNDEYQILSGVSKNEILLKDKEMFTTSHTELEAYLKKGRKEEIEFFSLVDKVLEKNPNGVGTYLDDTSQYKKEELSINSEISEYHPKFYLIFLAAYHRNTYYISDEELHKKECEIVDKLLKYQSTDKKLLKKIEQAAGAKMIKSIGGPLNAVAFYKLIQNINHQNG